MNTDNTAFERFVSLQGYFAIAYPTTWQSEVDENGHYLFFNANGGSGMVRILAVPHTYTEPNAAQRMHDEILAQHQQHEAQTRTDTSVLCVSYVQLHTISEAVYRVAYFAFPTAQQTWLFTYTIQDNMAQLPAALQEWELILKMIQSFSYLA
jgi:hypothetical protein